MIEEYINQSEAQGWLVSAKYYNALASNERANIVELKTKKAEMLKALNDAVASGTIKKESQAWYEMVNSIDEVTLAITESQTALKEYAQTIQQLDWEVFDLLQDKISSVAEESEFLIELMSNKKLYDDNGQLTNQGLATMGLNGQNYNTYMYQADLAAKEIKKLKEELSKDPFDTDLEARYREMISLQQDYIKSAEDAKNAIRDMVEEGINLELDSLQNLIDKYQESLDSQKDLYDYQKKVKEQTKEIASLEKQMSAYQGDNSEEARAKIQELKVSLDEAKTELEETEFDRLIENTQKITDELYSQYEEILNTRLDNIDALVSDMIEEINNNSSVISDTIRESADSVGYTLSDSMNTVWSASAKDVITNYGEKFTSAQTTTNNALKTINTNLQSMISQLNKIAKTNVKSARVSSVSDSEESGGKKSTSTTTTNTAPQTVTVGSRINAGTAKIYASAYGTGGGKQYYANDPIYVVLDENNGYWKVRYHKLSSGVTGWFKKSDVKAYKTGTKKIVDSEIAWTQEDGGTEYIVRPSDGAILTPLAKNDSVLNANASNNIWNMANNPSEFIRNNLGLDASDIPNNSTTHNSFTQNLDKVVFSFPNVKNYNEMLTQMQKDKNFERLVLSMSIDQIAGKSSLAKGKAIR